jgi:hypothetical protein
VRARWNKVETNRQCAEAVRRGRHATRGRKYFGRETRPDHLGYVGTLLVPDQTFEEFCTAQRILLERRLFHRTDEEREREADNAIDALIRRDLDFERRGRV